MSARPTINVGDVVLAGFKICSDRWRPLLKVTAVTILPAAIFGALLIATYTPNVLLDAMSDTTLDPQATDAAIRAIPSSEWVGLALAFLVYAIVGTLANVIALTASLQISMHHHDGAALTSQEALRLGLSKLGPMLWLMLLSGFLTLVGLVLCILPGIWLFVIWSVAPLVLLRENLRGRKALGRSSRLVKPTFWPVLAVLVLEFACLFVLQAITSIFPSMFLPSAAENNSFAVFFTLSVGGAIVGLIGVALHAAVSTELYFALGAPAEPEPPMP